MPAKKKTEEIKIVNSEAAEKLDPELEPAGFKRNEQMAQRKDQLEQAAEEATDGREIYGFDISKFDPEREIQNLLDELHVEGQLPDRRYFWCYEGQGGFFIRKALRLGWVMVKAEDPESPELKDARGYRKIGDTVLMWTPVENYERIRALSEYQQLVHEKGVGSALEELGERYAGRGFKVHGNVSEKSFGKGTLMDTMKSRAARQTAATAVSKSIKAGTVPGMPAGRRR